MKKGEIWLVDLYDGKGHEQKGMRPALIMGNSNGLSIVVPLTTNTNLATLSHTCLIDPAKENGLTETSVALVFQIVSLDQTRFKKQIGWIPKEQRAAIDALVKDLLKLSDD